MISIKDTVEYILIPCPKCKNVVFVSSWGEQTCLFLGCDGHKFVVDFNFDTAKLILQKVQETNVRLKVEKKNQVIFRPAMPKPDDWYNNDPFKQK